MNISSSQKESSINYAWIMGLGLLSIRVIQGFIYWGGGSRRFIYAPSKLDPTAAHWMAHKFQTAMPGALLGLDHIISFMLQHFWILYPAVIAFSLAELLVGLFLMAGVFTRISALISMGFSVLLMLMFGWQGATCIDEWTMAACNLAMGTTLFLCGSNLYALDNVILKKKPRLATSKVFAWCCGTLPMPLNQKQYKKLALILLGFVVLFDVGTYHHYRGSVVTPFHSGPVSPTVHHISLSNGVLNSDNSVSVHAYLDAGTPEAPIHIMDAWLIDEKGEKLAHWDTKTLSNLPTSAFVNDYAYGQFKSGHYGIQAPVGSASAIILPAIEGFQPQDNISLLMRDVAGKTYTIKLNTNH